MPHRTRIHFRELRLLRQLPHGQRRVMRSLLRTILRKPSQEFAAHRRRIFFLQRRFGHKLLQPRLQDGADTLRHNGAWRKDSQQCTHTVAGTHRCLLHGHEQDTVTPRHLDAAILVRHRRRQKDCRHTGYQPVHRRNIPRRHEMAEARQAPTERQKVIHHIRLALTFRNTEGKGRHKIPRSTAGRAGL